MLPEPWLRGPIPGVHPLVAPVLYAFQQAREDLAKFTEGLTPEQLWASPHGFGSAGFHIVHIAGSTERLMSYLQQRELTAEQMQALRDEARPLGCGARRTSRDPGSVICGMPRRPCARSIRRRSRSHAGLDGSNCRPRSSDC